MTLPSERDPEKAVRQEAENLIQAMRRIRVGVESNDPEATKNGVRAVKLSLNEWRRILHLIENEVRWLEREQPG